MFASAPRLFAEPRHIHERLAMLHIRERVSPLLAWSDAFVERREHEGVPTVLPHIDPADAGVEARVLILLDVPGSMAQNGNRRPGSGFASVDNDDQAAATVWTLRNEVGLHEHTAHWNIVPWYLRAARVKPTDREIMAGGTALREFVGLLPELRVVVAGGRAAQRGWAEQVAAQRPDLRVIDTWHPSPLTLQRPGRREQLRDALARAREIADA